MELIANTTRSAWHGIFGLRYIIIKHIDEEAVLLAVTLKKDVDGFHPLNMGRL